MRNTSQEPAPLPIRSSRSASAAVCPRTALAELGSPYFHRLDHDRPKLPPRAGTVVLDLEDGVGQRDKAARRRAIAELLARPLPPKARVLIRCNGQDATEEMLLDLEATCCAALAGFVLPMASSMNRSGTQPRHINAAGRMVQRFKSCRACSAASCSDAGMASLSELAVSCTLYRCKLRSPPVGGAVARHPSVL